MTINSFADLALSPSIQRAIAEANYTTPTPIQAAAIPHALTGRDLLGCAQTGTGKTAAFALPILHRLDETRQPVTPRSPQVLVLSPTRELATQIAESFRTYGRNLSLRQTVVFGGVGQNPQVKALARGVHILVATPGRLMDLMQQGHLRLDRVTMFVVDEADRMFDMGFLPSLRKIVAALPKQRQSLFFSATMPPEVAELAEALLKNPARVSVTPPASTAELIEQRVLFVNAGEKRSTLNRLLRDPEFAQVLVFTRTKRRADIVARQLQDEDIEADAIHGNKSQNARERALHKFRVGRTRVLVATDVAARGLDVDGISHVINYDLPNEAESYVHRIGRTGRAGATGIALSLCEPADRGALRGIERLIKRSIPVEQAPAGSEPAVREPSREPADRPRRRPGPTGSGRKPGPTARGRKPRRRVRVA